jgi:hypothetical protein
MPVPQADPQVRSPPATASSKAGMHWASTADAPNRVDNSVLAVPTSRGYRNPFSKWEACGSSYSAASNVAANVRRRRLPVLKGGFCVSTVSIVCGRARESMAVVAGCTYWTGRRLARPRVVIVIADDADLADGKLRSDSARRSYRSMAVSCRSERTIAMHLNIRRGRTSRR